MRFQNIRRVDEHAGPGLVTCLNAQEVRSRARLAQAVGSTSGRTGVGDRCDTPCGRCAGGVWQRHVQQRQVCESLPYSCRDFRRFIVANLVRV